MMTDLSIGHTLYTLDALEERVSGLIRQLPLRCPDGRYLIDDEALRTTTISAQAGAKAFWRLACAARAETVRRITERVGSGSATLGREIAREAAEQHTSVRTLRRDADIGMVFGQLFIEPDDAPDLDKTFYTIALSAPDPQAALAIAAQRKDANPLYSARDFEAEVARARLSDPAAAYGAASAGAVALAYLWPYWDEGVIEASERCLQLPLRRWLFPDAIVLLRTPPRALDLSCRILAAHDVRYQQAIIVPVPPYRDGCAWHECELVVCGTTGKLRLPQGLPGTWRDSAAHSIAQYFPFARPRLAVYPRQGMPLDDSWVTPEELPR
jgi:hypothetical protein